MKLRFTPLKEVMGLLGQVMFYVDYYNMTVNHEVRLGEIYTDGLQRIAMAKMT